MRTDNPNPKFFVGSRALIIILSLVMMGAAFAVFIQAALAGANNTIQTVSAVAAFMTVAIVIMTLDGRALLLMDINLWKDYQMLLAYDFRKSPVKAATHMLRGFNQ